MKSSTFLWSRSLFRFLAVLVLPIVLLAVGLAAQKPVVEEEEPVKKAPKKLPKEEEEEPVKPRPKVPVRVEEDEPAPRPAKPAAGPATDLAAEARDASHPAVRDLFRDLAVPHDAAVMGSGNRRNIAPIAAYLGTKPKPAFKVMFQTFDSDWKLSQEYPVSGQDIRSIMPYEEVAWLRVDQFLKSGLEKETPGGAKHLARPDMLVQAEKVLAAVIRFHESARERGLRQGEGWDGVQKTLQQRLLAVQLEQLRALANAKEWEPATDLATRLAEVYPNQPAVQLAIVHLQVQHAEHSLQGGKDGDFISVRQTLERLEKDLLNNDDKDAKPIRQRIEFIRTRLRDRAAQLWEQAKAVEKKDKVSAVRMMGIAEAVWPQLPGLQDERLKLSNAYPVLYVGVRQLPEWLSPGTALTDCERQVVELLFESLVKPIYDPGLGQRYEPGLADGRPRLVSLGRQFQLAHGARWSNGELVTASDVHGTVQLLKDRDWLGFAPEWADLVKGARVDDPFRFNLTLNRGYLDPLALMTFKVLPARYLRHMEDQGFAANPIGSGPFQYLGRKQEQGRPYALFQANPNYSNRAGKDNRPLIREIRLVRSDEPVVDFQRRRGGAMHLLLDLPTEKIKQLESPEAGLQNEVQVVTLRNRRVYFLAINQRRSDLQSQDLRKAIAYALDREKMLNDHFRVNLDERARATVHRWLNGPYPRGSWACAPEFEVNDPNNPYYPFQPNRVKSLADKAQMSGKKLTLKYPTDDPRVEMACGYIQTQVQNFTGLTLELKGLPPRELRKQVEVEHDYDLAYYHWDYANEAYWLWPLFDPEAAGRGGRNFLGVNDPELQMLFRRALVHRQFKEVQALTWQIHRELYEKMPLIPLWQLDTHLAVHRELQTVPPPIGLDPQAVFAAVEQWKLGK